MYNERINPQTLIVVLRKCITLVVLAVAPLALFFVVETVITWIAFITFCKSFTEKENISMLQRCVITVYIGSERNDAAQCSLAACHKPELFQT